MSFLLLKRLYHSNSARKSLLKTHLLPRILSYSSCCSLNPIHEQFVSAGKFDNGFPSVFSFNWKVQYGSTFTRLACSQAAVESSTFDGLTVERIIANNWTIYDENENDWKSHASAIARSIHLIKKRLRWKRLLQRVETLSEQLNKPDLWEGPADAGKISREHGSLMGKLKEVNSFEQELFKYIDRLKLAREDNDPELESESLNGLLTLRISIKEKELESLPAGEHDSCSCFIEYNFQASSLENSVKHFVSLANEGKYPKIRALLHKFVKHEKAPPVSSFCHALSTSSDNLCANHIIFDILMSSYVNNTKLDLALESFKRAGDYGFKFSVLSCNSLLGMLVKECRIGSLEFVYKEMIRRRIELNLITFNTMINGLCKAGKLNKARDMVEDMKVRQVLPNVVTYNTLIDGYCKRGGMGKLYQAKMLFKEMMENRVLPNVVTYNILIDGSCKDGSLVSGIKLFRELKEQGLKPSAITFNTLINGLCIGGKIDEAMTLKEDMVKSGLEPNIATYNALINGFAKKNMLTETREFLDEIVKKGIVVNVLTYNTLIDAYCKAGKVEDASSIYYMMLERMMYPNVSTYNSLIGGYFRGGNIEEVNKLLFEMEKNGLKADIITYNIRINAMCKIGQTRNGVRLLDEMSQKGLNPTHVTYNALVAGYCHQGNRRAALTMMKRMEKEGKRPNVVTYNVLIKDHCQNGKLEEANRLLNEMLEKGLVPNRITYDIIKEEMVEKGFIPDIDGHLYNDSV
ncbi:uncharacterized protein [Henckelia pumila]|uniref:uncharacterized protein isoform X1 n=1 Tax=Henckelia pumila TaxID=405737 RepID=UPI003C6E9CA3